VVPEREEGEAPGSLRRARVFFGTLGLLGMLVPLLASPGGSPAAATPVESQQEGQRNLVRVHDLTSFPLVGKHQLVECGDCHLGGNLEGTPQQCEVCHWTRRQDDPYRLQLGTVCGDCHSPQSWKNINPGAWEHERVTGFRLEGAHRTVECTACHGTRGLSPAVAQCSACHLQDFRQAKAPDHAAAGFPSDCQICHLSAVTWQGAKFDHSFWPLQGNHQTAECAACHKNGKFAGTSTQCVDCHRAEYDRTTNPDHKKAGFPTECAACHGASAVSWQGATFDHDRFFALKGKHKTADCTECHVNGKYAGTSSNCVDCHRAEYDRTTNPNHRQAGFSTDCASCHGTAATTWSGAGFDHDRFFALKGKHKTAACSQCHPNGRFPNTPTNCIDCHRADYDRALNPNHRQAGFSTDCTQCHGTAATTWKGAQFDHNRFFVLQGAHTRLDCQACHKNGYNLPKDCYGCHAANYNATRNPDHRAAGFPTTCESCHLPSHVAWNQAKFNHAFPIDSGKHKGLACSECHRSGNYRVFSCIDCHAHEKLKMDKKHDKVAGYTYASQACYTCHPNGRKP
jgi:hypothetical protein